MVRYFDPSFVESVERGAYVSCFVLGRRHGGSAERRFPVIVTVLSSKCIRL